MSENVVGPTEQITNDPPPLPLGVLRTSLATGGVRGTCSWPDAPGATCEALKQGLVVHPRDTWVPDTRIVRKILDEKDRRLAEVEDVLQQVVQRAEYVDNGYKKCCFCHRDRFTGTHEKTCVVTAILKVLGEKKSAGGAVG